MDDMISRQEAIDAIMDEVEPFAIVEAGTTCVIGIGVNNADVVRVLEQLPPAQPEKRWKPCSERLPERQNPVLVYVAPYNDENEECIGYVGMAYYTHSVNNGYWCGTDGNVYGAIGIIHDPSYWMPLPEPYTERWEE